MRLIDSEGHWLCSLVDDTSVHAGLGDQSSDFAGHRFITTFEDVAEELSAAPGEPFWECSRTELMERTLRATLAEGGPDGTRVVRRGQKAIGVLTPYPRQRGRVCEVITRPLLRDEREKVWSGLMASVSGLGFRPALDGAIHVHFDAGPWQDTERLARLILGWTERRAELLAHLAPNPRTARFREPFSESILEMARGDLAIPFEIFAQLLLACGPSKFGELNLLGVISPRARQPTLEVRCLPAELQSERTMERIKLVEQVLLALA